MTPIAPYPVAHWPNMALVLLAALFSVLAGYALWLPLDLASDGVLALHSGLETLAIVLACLIFTVGWYAHGPDRPASIALLAAVMPWVAALDFLHLLSFGGLPENLDKGFLGGSINFDIASRLLVLLALLGAACLPWRPYGQQATRYWVFGLAGLYAFGVVFGGVLGLAPSPVLLGRGAAVGLFALGMLAVSMFWRRQSRRGAPNRGGWMLAAAIILAGSELLGAGGQSADGAFIFLGHAYKVLAYVLIYRLVFSESVQSPFLQLQQSRDHLRLREEAVRHSESEYRLVIDSVREVIFRVDADGRWQFLNQAWTNLTGYDVAESLGRPFVDFLVAEERDRIGVRFLGLVGGKLTVSHHETRYRMKGGGYRWVEVHSRSLCDPDGKSLGTLGTLNDITERKRAEELSHELNLILTMVAADKGLKEVLTRLALLIEHHSADGFCSFMLLDKSHSQFQWGLGPKLPEEYLAGLMGLNIGPDVGSCGSAAWLGEPVMVRDIEKDPRWAPYAAFARGFGLAACSSWPIFDRKGKVIATLAIYYPTPKTPSADEIKLIEPAIDLARIAIESAETEERIRYLAHHDDLTGLPNRVAFNECLQHFLYLAQRHVRKGAVMFIDLDRFKLVNDTLGHDAGDAVLREASERIAKSLRDSDTVARIGGDEFYVLLEEYEDLADLRTVAMRILTSMARPFALQGHDFHLTASIGVSTYPQDGGDSQALMKNADIAMYRAKKLGKNTYQFYSEEMNEHTLERLELESRLRRAMDQDELVLYYQPKLEMLSGRVIGVEALMRWRNQDGSLVPPMEFIPLAEETGLIVPMSRWALQTACRQALQWHAQGLTDLTVAVNLSARHFRQKDIVADVARVLEETGLAGRYLELEITESMVMENPEEAVTIMQALKYMGVALSIDDFGTGYSSLAYLKRFPVDSVKIDRSFIRDIPDDEDDVAITQATLAMARSLKLKVVAEGVETLAQRDFLAHQGCDQFQGFLLARPLSAEQLPGFVAGLPAPGAQKSGYAPLAVADVSGI